MTKQLVRRGNLVCHRGWITQIATTPSPPDLTLSTSRDKTMIVWDLRPECGSFGLPQRSLHGHYHFISDVVMSSDGQFALSGSWDRTLHLWNLKTGQTTRRFCGHTGDVLSVAFSADNKQIVSGSREHTARLWKTTGQCKYVFNDRGHTDWISCVHFSTNTENSIVVTWDGIN